MSASRSTTWTIQNATDGDLTLVKQDLDHGVWAANPAKVIPAGRSAMFTAESDGFMTGDEGTVTYSSAAGFFVFYFNNPYIGADGYSVGCPQNYDHSTNQSTGNNQTLVTRLFAVGSRTK